MEKHTPGNPSERSFPVPPKGIAEHELLRCIGGGSYGDVWLVKTVLGTYRAVKVVYRNKFDDAEPYEREYRGIKNFEPVSRTHDGLVDVLQVGRDDEAGFFYYIMELADDQGPGPLNPKTYAPKTLRTEKPKWGKYSFDEVLRLSMGLAGALAHLHKKGLVHRDLKPSNIIFINEAPKLADVGLVAEASEARSFVGTPGYIPPEGPGAPQADIFSLGKVIYEVATGKDRQEYPRLPPDWDQDTGKEKFNELNEILLKACETDTKERYATAEELLADLTLLQAGKSIKRLRLLERRFALLIRYGIAALLLMSIVWGAVHLVLRERRREREGRLQQARASVAYGLKLMDEGNLSGALPWFAEGLNLDHDTSENERDHRVRIEAVRRQCPKLKQIWRLEGQPRFGRFSPDGTVIAAARLEGGVEVLDIATGKRVAQPIKNGVGKRVRTVCFSPDGQYLVTAGFDHFARRWDRQKGEEILPALAHKGKVLSAEFSPNGKQVLTACEDRNAYLWDWATGKLLFSFEGHEDQVLYAGFSPDGLKIVTASKDFSAIIWEVATRQSGPRLWHKNWVYQAVFSPDNQTVVTASYDGVVQIWDALTGEAAYKPLLHPAGVGSAEFSPDGRYLATSGWDFAARVWDLKTGELANTPLAHGGQVTHCSFSPEGRYLLTFSRDRMIRLWDLESNSWLPSSVPAVFSPSGERFFIITNFVVRVGTDWVGDKKTEALAAKAQGVVPSQSGAYLLAISSTNIPSRGEMKTLQVWDVVRNTPRGVPFQSEQFRNRWLLTDDGLCAIGIYQRNLQVWDTVKGQQAYSPLQLPAFVQKLVLADNGKYFVVLFETNAVIYNTKTGKALSPPLPHACPVVHTAFNPKATRLVTACADGGVEPRYAQVWSVPDGKPLYNSLKHKDGVLYATFSPDGRLIATASEDSTARLWDADTGQEVGPPLKHLRDVFQVQFSPDGRWVVTGCRDGTARVWEVSSGHALTPPLKHPAPVREVQFVGNGKGIMTQMEWRTFFVWDLRPDNQSMEEIGLEAEFQSASSVSSSGKIKPKNESELLEWWQKRKAKDLAYPSNALSMLAWHERQMESAEKLNLPFAARFHLNWLISIQPDNSELYARRAAMNAALGQWKEAESDYTKAVVMGNKSPLLLCQQAHVCLALGNTNAYRTICAELSRQAPILKEQNVRNTACWTIALLPNALENYALAIEAAKSAVAYTLLQDKAAQALGALQYRAGNWAESLKTLDAHLRSVGETSMVESWLIVAMAHYRLGHKPEALVWLAKAQRWIHGVMGQKNKPDDTGYQLSWQRRLDLSLLAAEATALIEQATKPDN